MPAAIAIPAIISAGASVGGALIQRNAANKATQAETDAGNKALALQQQQFEETRGDLAPYRNVGSGALSKLGSIFGVDTGGGAPAPAPLTDAQKAQQVIPQVTRGFDQTIGNWMRGNNGTLSTLGGASSGAAGVVPVQAPDGNIYKVPQAQVRTALSNGGKVVQ